jgi:hypothetical protein
LIVEGGLVNLKVVFERLDWICKIYESVLDNFGLEKVEKVSFEALDCF